LPFPRSSINLYHVFYFVTGIVLFKSFLRWHFPQWLWSLTYPPRPFASVHPQHTHMRQDSRPLFPWQVFPTSLLLWTFPSSPPPKPLPQRMTAFISPASSRRSRLFLFFYPFFPSSVIHDDVQQIFSPFPPSRWTPLFFFGLLFNSASLWVCLSSFFYTISRHPFPLFYAIIFTTVVFSFFFSFFFPVAPLHPPLRRHPLLPVRPSVLSPLPNLTDSNSASTLFFLFSCLLNSTTDLLSFSLSLPSSEVSFFNFFTCHSFFSPHVSHPGILFLIVLPDISAFSRLIFPCLR